MTLLKFEIAVASADGVGESDRVWFPKWLRRYAMTFPQGLVNELAVNRETTLQFSRMLLEAGAPAWQRWQAVRSLECYRDLVLGRSEPDLSSIIAKLSQMGKQERNLDLEVPPTEEELAIIRGKNGSCRTRAGSDDAWRHACAALLDGDGESIRAVGKAIHGTRGVDGTGAVQRTGYRVIFDQAGGRWEGGSEHADAGAIIAAVSLRVHPGQADRLLERGACEASRDDAGVV